MHQRPARYPRTLLLGRTRYTWPGRPGSQLDA